jgi:predicted AAA+ superfamily ATPase
MINRLAQKKLRESAQWAPAIAILGPRQSGKTTLAQATFNKHRYITLEDPTVRTFALNDPHGFLASIENEHGVILDEFQNIPMLLSYIQGIIDAIKRPGYFILTGSQNFLVSQTITQSLAGRIAIHTLLPLSLQELSDAQLLAATPEEVIFRGGYPRLFDMPAAPISWYTDYVTTYLERDIRSIQAISDLNAFHTFVQLCAGRIGQQLNLTALGAEVGISHNTARAWLSLLEASYIVFLVYPYYKNFSKRLIKTPKLYFYDTGLACNLLRIESVTQLMSHYLRGGLFESYIIADLYKQYYNRGIRPAIYFWKDQRHEVDCVIEQATTLVPIEIKAGKTLNPDLFDSLTYFQEVAKEATSPGFLIYGGTNPFPYKGFNSVTWNHAGKLIETLYESKPPKNQQFS